MVETKFKHTDIGLIPEDWKYDFAGNYLDFLTGFPFKSNEFSNTGTKLLRGSNVKRNEIVWNDDITRYWSNADSSLKKYFLKEGDIIISMDGSLVGKSFGQISKGDLPSLLVQRVARLRGVSIDTDYLKQFYCSDYFTKHCDNNKTSSAIPHISPKDILEFKISFPKSIKEQQAIAEVLSDTDAWIESLEKLIAKKQLIKQGTMQKLLTPKEDWEVKKLGEVCAVIGGGTPSTFNNEFWNGNINWFTPTEVGYKKYLTSSNRKISEAGLMNSSANMLPINSILLTTRAGIGDVGILKVEACTNQGFQSLACHSNTHYEFIYYLMQTKKSELLNNASGSTFLEISPNKIKSIEIQIPSLPEQTRIATILSDMDIEIEALKQKLIKAKQIKQGLMQELLTGRIRLVRSNDKKETKPVKGHNDHFNDAVLIGTMASCFASEQFPLTRFKYTKVSYLLKRYKEEQTTEYLKKAAGPYKPETRYGGAEKIAINRKYISVKKSIYKGKQYEGFLQSENIEEALNYFKSWYGEDSLEWIKQFKFETHDNLELWATVDMAIRDLKQEGKVINLGTLKQVIKENKEWRDKLKRPAFSDKNIESAICKVETLYT